MSFRAPLSPTTSKQLFRRTASYTHKKNVAPNPMRGGIRL